MRKSPVSSRKEIHLDPLPVELQWWALGGYAAVVVGMKRQGQQWSRAKAAKRVKYLIDQQYAVTHAQLWCPQTSQEYEKLRSKIRVGESLDETLY